MTPHELVLFRPLSFAFRKQWALGWLKTFYYLLAGFMFAGPVWLSLHHDSSVRRLARIELFGSTAAELFLAVSSACFAASLSQTNRPALRRAYGWLHLMSKYFVAISCINLGRVAGWAYFSNLTFDRGWLWRGPWCSVALLVAGLTVYWAVLWVRRRTMAQVVREARMGLLFATAGACFIVILFSSTSLPAWIPRVALLTGLVIYGLAWRKLERPKRRLLHLFTLPGAMAGLVALGLASNYGLERSLPLWLPAVLTTLGLGGWTGYQWWRRKNSTRST